MSRSRKRNPIHTDGRSGKVGKKLANRKVRRALTEYPPKSKNYKKEFESYDIHDWVLRWTKEEALEKYRNAESDSWMRTKYPTEKSFLNYWAKIYQRK